MGKPLIIRVIEGVHSESYSTVVATDSVRILQTVQSFGYEAVLTGKASNGTERVFMAWEKLGRPEGLIVNLQGDEPGADPSWVSALTAACPSGNQVVTLSRRVSALKAADTSVVKVVCDRNGKALYFSRSLIPWNGKVFSQHIGVYCFTHESLPLCAGMTGTPLSAAENLEQLTWLENGIDVRVIEGDWNGMGVDTPEDLEEARRWFKNS